MNAAIDAILETFSSNFKEKVAEYAGPVINSFTIVHPKILTSEKIDISL